MLRSRFKRKDEQFELRFYFVHGKLRQDGNAKTKLLQNTIFIDVVSTKNIIYNINTCLSKHVKINFENLTKKIEKYNFKSSDNALVTGKIVRNYLYISIVVRPNGRPVSFK